MLGSPAFTTGEGCDDDGWWRIGAAEFRQQRGDGAAETRRQAKAVTTNKALREVEGSRLLESRDMLQTYYVK